MSAVIDQAPTVSEPLRTGRRPAAAVLALARFEARELLRQPTVLVVFLLYAGYTYWQLLFPENGMDRYPVLHYADRATQPGTLALALVVLLAANITAQRSRRQGTDQHFDILVMEPWRRTLAHALSVVPLAALTALIVAVEFAWTALKPGAVGHGSVAELAVGPLVTLAAGIVGVLAARVIPSVLGGAVVVALGGIASLAASLFTGPDPEHSQWLDWLNPVVSENGLDPIPSALLGRPAGWHVLYLAGLTALLLCVTLLLSGGRTRLVKAGTAVALAATVGGVAGQSPSHDAALTAARTKASHAPVTAQSCVTHHRSTYCSFPEWTAWRDDWAQVVDRVQGLTGGGARGARLTIRQRIPVVYNLTDDSAIMPLRTPGEITAGTRWGGTRVPEFAVGVASVLVAGDEEAASKMCDARVVTVMWLALAAQDDPMTALRDVRIDNSVTGSAGALSITDPVLMSTEQTRIVRDLLKRPRYSVTARMKTHWAELTSPKTSLTQVAELLGVPAGKAAAEEKGAAGEEGSC
ncbi:ABC transporter permease [Streptomyces sp. RY43-2]|uniref:ABC transporter permease n=1 Tax=Streptomyces macrolidinus TaxID=2952607 RepID=A0ABT0ZKY0_9ACTN|nr:ABC transporter permease [Streptomyces macrolidinus]MCN9244187.1 ABC transporter permease [Streptomyces macrolidinus]